MGSEDLPLLRLLDVGLTHGGKTCLEGVNWSCMRGESHGIMGPRGAGKSVLAQLIAGQFESTQGRMIWQGEDVQNNSQADCLRRGIHLIDDHSSPIAHFSLLENLCFPYEDLAPWQMWKRREIMLEAENYLKRYFGNTNLSSLARDLSEVETLEFVILRALFKGPSLLILDEIFPLLSHGFRERVWALIRERCRESMTLIWISHSLNDMDEHSDHISVMKDGHLVLTHSQDELSRPQLIRLCYDELSHEAYSEQTSFDNLMVFLETLLKRFPMMALALDAQGKVILMNQPARAFFDVEKDNGVTLKALLGPKHPELYLKIDEARLQESETILYLEPFKRTEDTEDILDIRIFPLKQKGESLGTMITLVDMTEQVNLRQQAMLSEELAGLGLLAAGVAHEINNPLEVLYNDLSYLRFKHKDQKDLLNTIEHLQEQATHIQEIVSNLVNFSGETAEEQEHFSLNELLESLLKFLTMEAKERSIKLLVHYSVDHCEIFAQRNEIKQVILNIVKNAFEAMPTGGILDIETKSESDAIEVHFSDSGCGLEAPHAVFRPFYSTKKCNGKNMGLGMSIIYGLVKKHGGDIEIKNKLEGGCCVSVTWPRG